MVISKAKDMSSTRLRRCREKLQAALDQFKDAWPAELDWQRRQTSTGPSPSWGIPRATRELLRRDFFVFTLQRESLCIFFIIMHIFTQKFAL